MLSAPCGGNGKCGKCRVDILGEKGRESVLACRYRLDGDLELVLPESGGGSICDSGTEVCITKTDGREGLGAALDLGTTTLVMKLYDLSDGRELGSQSAWNSQGSYGADVISRCQYVMEREDGLERLAESIHRQTFSMAEELISRAGRAREKLRELYVSGNTVMEHIFMGLSPVGLAVAPFKAESLFTGGYSKKIQGVEVHPAPCAASYVGGDIMAGLLSSGLWHREELNLFLDIGTNGEMALGNKEGFTCCAVASGPAFEGAGISCGMASTRGAVNKVSWNGKDFEYSVIGGGEARGFCGSGLISLLALLLSLGAVDESGWLLPPEETPEKLRPWIKEDENGNGCFCLGDELYLTAADVRQLQLAKGAVAAGIEVLLDSRGLKAGDVQGVYIAGGFGSGLDAQAAGEISMLPRELAGKVRSLGNSSLAGAALALLDKNSREQLYNIQSKCRYIELSGDSRFNQAFPRHMMFNEEDEPEWN